MYNHIKKITESYRKKKQYKSNKNLGLRTNHENVCRDESRGRLLSRNSLQTAAILRDCFLLRVGAVLAVVGSQQSCVRAAVLRASCTLSLRQTFRPQV